MKNLVILLAFVFAVSITLTAQSTEKKEVKKTEVDHSSCNTVKKVDDKVKTTTSNIKHSETKKMTMKECKEGETSGCCSDMKKTETVNKDQETKDQKK